MELGRLKRLVEDVTVSAIMTAYNEEERVEACFNKVAEALDEYG